MTTFLILLCKAKLWTENGRIASLLLEVNIECHSHRHKSAVL